MDSIFVCAIHFAMHFSVIALMREKSRVKQLKALFGEREAVLFSFASFDGSADIDGWLDTERK